MSPDSLTDSPQSRRRAQTLEEYAASLAEREELLELTHDAILVRDIAGEIIFWNRGAEELYGWSRYDARGKTTHAVLQTEFPEPLEQIIDYVKQHGRWDGELVHTRKDGARVIVASRWTLQYAADGTPLGILEMNDDVTERRRADLALRASQAQFAGIINSAMDAIISADDNQNIIIFNAAAEIMFGWSAAEVLGKPLTTLIPHELRQAHVQDVTKFGRMGVSNRVMGRLGELRGLRKDGSVFPIEASISQVETDGSKIYSVILRDITQRKQDERELRYFAELLRNVSDAIFTTDAEYKVLSWNHGAEMLYGWSAEEIIGKSINDLIRTNKPGEENPEILQAFLATGRWGGEEVHRRKDGALIDIQASSSVLMDQQGNPVAVVTVNRDITARKRAEAALHRSEQVLKLFVENAPAAIAMFDRDMNYIAVSRRYLTDYQLGAQNLIGHSHYEIFPEIPDEWKEIHRRALAGAIEKRDEDVLPRSDGTLDWIRWEIRPWHENAGAIGGIILFSEVITEYKRAQAAEREQHILAQALSDTAAALNGTLDFVTVLDQILENANRVVPHDASTIMLLEDGLARVVRSRGYPADRSDRIVWLRLPVSETRNLQEIVDTGQPVVIADVTRYTGWRETAVVAAQRASLGAPIRSKGQVIGFINLDSFTPDTFSPSDAAHLLAFADQAAVAMENARLLDEAQTRAQEFSELYGMAHDFTLQKDLPTLLQTVVTRAAQLLGASSGVLWLYDAQQNELEGAVSFNFPTLVGIRIKVGVGASGHVAATREPLIVNDYNASPYQGTVPAAPNFSSVVIVPLLSAGELMGVLVVGEPTKATREFDQADVQLLSLLAGPAAGAIYRG